jgi:dTDP-glucose pyrophosphorylase
MIELVLQNLAPSEPHQFICICRDEHLQRFALGDVLTLVSPGRIVVPMRQPTAGALCSVLLAAEHLSTDDELIVANADQIVDLPIDQFLAEARQGDWDGYMITFPSSHPRWSFARVEDGQVVAVAEKRPISRHATAGIYWFRSSRAFLAAAEAMLIKDASIGGEFYVCPVYNEMILAGLKIGIREVPREAMHSLGTPEDMEQFAEGLRGPGKDPE